MHSWPHIAPNKDSNFPVFSFFFEDASDGSYNNFGRIYFKMKKANLTEVEPATEFCFTQILLLGDPDSLLLELGKIKLNAVVFLSRQYSEPDSDAMFSHSQVITRHRQENPFIIDQASVLGKVSLKSRNAHYFDIADVYVMVVTWIVLP